MSLCLYKSHMLPNKPNGKILGYDYGGFDIPKIKISLKDVFFKETYHMPEHGILH